VFASGDMTSNIPFVFYRQLHNLSGRNGPNQMPHSSSVLTSLNCLLVGLMAAMLDVLNSCIVVLDSPYSKWQLDTFKNLQRTERREHEAFSRFIHV